MKIAYVYKDRTGFWVAWDSETNSMIGGYYDTELQAYKAANRNGFVVK
jgi:hypothetical protein